MQSSHDVVRLSSVRTVSRTDCSNPAVGSSPAMLLRRAAAPWSRCRGLCGAAPRPLGAWLTSFKQQQREEAQEPPAIDVDGSTNTPPSAEAPRASVPMHHAQNKSIMPQIKRSSSHAHLLELFEEHAQPLPNNFGWMTVKETVVRMAQLTQKRRGGPFDRDDARLRAMLGVCERALAAGAMTSIARLGRRSDDLTALSRSLEILELSDCSLTEALEAQLEEEEDIYAGLYGDDGEEDDPIGWEAR